MQRCMLMSGVLVILSSYHVWLRINLRRMIFMETSMMTCIYMLIETSTRLIKFITNLVHLLKVQWGWYYRVFYKCLSRLWWRHGSFRDHWGRDSSSEQASKWWTSVFLNEILTTVGMAIESFFTFQPTYWNEIIDIWLTLLWIARNLLAFLYLHLIASR